VFDIIYLIEILFNFLKRTRAYPTIWAISKRYVSSYFIFDVLSTIPLPANESLSFYGFKLFRLVHLFRLTKPLELLLSYLLQKYSKKRQNDLTSFCSLILLVIYSSHLNACIWIWLGSRAACKEFPDKEYDEKTNSLQNCTPSWIYANGFENQPTHS